MMSVSQIECLVCGIHGTYADVGSPPRGNDWRLASNRIGGYVCGPVCDAVIEQCDERRKAEKEAAKKAAKAARKATQQKQENPDA
jgi:hypothetical protein